MMTFVNNNKSLEIRPRDVRSEDIKYICSMPQNAAELYHMFPKAEYPLCEEQMEETLTTRFCSTVFLHDNKVIGFANFYEVKEQEYCSLGNLIISSEYRHKGIGRFIIKTMERKGTELYGIKEMHISCFNDNTSGLLLYNELNYIPYSFEKRINKEMHSIVLIKMKKIL